MQRPKTVAEILFALALLLGLVSLSFAQTAPTTLSWDRNAEIDVGVYKMFACNTSTTCVPGTGAADQIGADIPQPAVGTNPSMLIPPGTQGRAAVMAVDLVGNRSPLSNVVSFDRAAPGAPTNLGTK